MASLSRRKLAERVATRLANGDAKHTVLKELAAYLIDTRRVHEAELIVRDIETSLAQKGTVVATVTSARALSPESLGDLESYITELYSTAEQVVLRARIDESLIGGVKLDMPGKSLDASVKAKLDKLTV